MYDPLTRQLHITPEQKRELLSLNPVKDFDRWLQILREAGHPLDGPVDVFCNQVPLENG